MEFRKDVEGLRAIAVIPILLFHAGVSQLSGGFVGVDIFFVISGFLITRIISNDIENGSFSIKTFYGHRIIRIFPLLILVVALSNLLGYASFYPADNKILGESSVAAGLFVSNLYFWRNVDYFTPPSQYTPLLHTWSLGVEEQFYIFFPILMMAAFARLRGRKEISWLITVLSLLSFALALWLSLTDRERTSFYTLPSRAWELGIGAIVALGGFPSIRAPKLREIVTVLALALIVFAVFFIRPEFTFPAPWALVPCLGTALLIGYAPGTLVGRMLSVPPLRSIGRVSYAIYLWHWPIIVFYKVYIGYKIYLEHNFTIQDISICVILTLIAAYASTFLLERPLIKRYRGARPRLIFATSLPAMAAVVLTGLFIARNPGKPQDYAPEIASVIGYASYETTEDYRAQFRPGKCFITSFDRAADSDCTRLDENRPNVVLAGDSLAAQYWRAYQDRFPEYNVIQATAPGCRPTLNPVGKPLCKAAVNDVMMRLVPSEQTRTVILSASWKESDLANLRSTIEYIKSRGKKLILVGPSLAYDVDYPGALATAISKHNLDLLESLRTRDSLPLSDQMRKLAQALDIEFVSPIDILCPDGKCMRMTEGGIPSHFDKIHLTLQASREVVDWFPSP